MGKLGRARGLNGEMYVTPLTDFPERFLELKEIFVKTKAEWKATAIRASRLIGGRPVVLLEGITNPEQAAAYTNKELAVTESDIVALPEGQHYIFDLVGCALIDEASGDTLGEIVDVEHYPANDVYVVSSPDAKKRLFPAVEDFVRKIDTKGRKVLVRKAGFIED